MITIPQVVEQIVKDTPFLEEGIALGIINYSALARTIKPRVSKQLYKDVQDGAVMMALKRLVEKVRDKRINLNIFIQSYGIVVRSNLVELTFLNNDFGIDKFGQLLKFIHTDRRLFFTVTQGSYETTIIASADLREKIMSLVNEDRIISEFSNVSAITVRLTKEAIPTPGVYYNMLKLLAWEGINVIEVVSTYLEFTIILENKDIDKAFSILKNY